MKKKLLLITGMLLIATAGFAVEWETMRTSSGREAFVMYGYMGKDESQTLLDDLIPAKSQPTKPSEDYWEIINKVLSKYDIAEGDTFSMIITFQLSTTFTLFICKFTSAIDYEYWAFAAPKDYE
jgi:hypothetical protein